MGTSSVSRFRSGLLATTALACLVAPLARAAGPSPAAEQAFSTYIAAAESRMDRRPTASAFLSIDALPEPDRRAAYAELRQGQLLIRPEDAAASPVVVPGGLIHDWIGTVFIPGTRLAHVLSVLSDYDRDASYYSPEVVGSKLLAQSGNDFRIFLRLREIHVVPVVLDTEYEVRYAQLDADRALSRSYSTRISEIEDAGGPHERALPTQSDHGFLWHLDSYWRFYQADGGVYVECEAISLTRDVPVGLALLLRPMLETVPAASLRFTLEATRNAVVESLSLPLQK